MTADLPEDEMVRSIPMNRNTSPSKLRRGKKHCPFCLAPLQKNATRTKLIKECKACGAHIQINKVCLKCSGGPIWQGKQGAACQSCGLHGKSQDVIANPNTQPA